MRRHRFIFLLIVCISSSVTISAQDKAVSTLDSLFAGVPLDNKYTDWYEYIRDHPHLGIDSADRRGTYSSFKPGIDSKFPFPDNCKVKLIFGLEVVNLKAFKKDLGYDTVKAIMIEGCFGDNREGKDQAKSTFNSIRKILNQKYTRIDDNGNSIEFTNASSRDFPPCELFWGYESRLRMHYVIIAFAKGRYIWNVETLIVGGRPIR